MRNILVSGGILLADMFTQTSAYVLNPEWESTGGLTIVCAIGLLLSVHKFAGDLFAVLTEFDETSTV